MYIVYKIENLINGKVYIGFTSKTPELRFKWHCTMKNCTKMKYAIDKYGKDNFKIYSIFETTCRTTALLMESKFIEEYNSIEKGYNLTKGGIAPELSVESKMKMSKARKGKKRPPMSEEQKAKISMTRIERGIKPSKESIVKGLETRKRNAKPFPADFGKKISERQLGENNPTAKKIICNETKEEFSCIIEAARAYSINVGSINHVLRGRNKTAGKNKLTFSYITE